MAKKKSVRRLTKRDIYSFLIDFFESQPGKSFTTKQVFAALRLTTHAPKMVCLDVLDQLLLEDRIARTDDGVYHFVVRTQTMEGIFRRRSNGRNVVEPLDGGKSILVFERNSHHALDGDQVRVTLLAKRRSHAREAMVTEVVKRAHDTFVGRLKVEKQYGFLITESRILAQDIFIPKGALGKGRTGDKAVVKITEWPDDAKSPIGKVIDVLGKSGENNAEMHSILVEYGLPYKYPERVEQAANAIDPGITPEEIARREDFREVTTFTIDPRDAKDFDDALSVRLVSEKWGDAKAVYEVGVHIADVSHYVHEGDIIDKEAQRRATSIYLVDRTIPMLPERLCNFICSLRPDEEKLTYSAVFCMNAKAEVLSWHLAHTVIKSNRRFAYEEVQEILEQNGQASPQDLALPGEHPQVVGSAEQPVGEYARELILLDALAKQLRANRFHKGSIGFDRPEIRFEINEKGTPVGTYIKVAKDANKLVEEFMLLANRYVAEHVGRVPKGKKAKVLPYRIHDVPDQDKLEKLAAFAGKFGHRLRTDGSKTDVAKRLNKLLEDVHGRAEEKAVEMVALRAMQKARYSTHNIGHYGLMFPYYTHFTSPIRRYPDTMVHRLLTRYEAGGRSASREKYEDLCDHSSDMEILATQAERASIKYKQVEFMAARVGQIFDGHICGITEFGFYVELEENGCEGFVSLRDLQDDYYEYDDRNFCLVGRRSNRHYSLGDKVRVSVARANLDRKQLDFQLTE
ncbi:MAG: ribonuclease R [Bacteroidaceae bacterium]|nr:ribonuclease R [Bacteroidaceae bacterium]